MAIKAKFLTPIGVGLNIFEKKHQTALQIKVA